jgi:hypothetical protein
MAFAFKEIQKTIFESTPKSGISSLETKRSNINALTFYIV